MSGTQGFLREVTTASSQLPQYGRKKLTKIKIPYSIAVSDIMEFENKSGPCWAIFMKHTQNALFHVNGEIGLCAKSDLAV